MQERGWEWLGKVWALAQANKAVLVSLIVAVTGLIQAIKEPGAVKTYEKLKDSVELQNKATQQNHDDLVKVRDWIEELRKADTVNRDLCARTCPIGHPLVTLANPSASADPSVAPPPAYASAKPEELKSSGPVRTGVTEPVKSGRVVSYKYARPKLKKPQPVVLPKSLAD